MACLAKNDSSVLFILWATDMIEGIPCILQFCDAPVLRVLLRTPGRTCLHGTKACRLPRTAL